MLLQASLSVKGQEPGEGGMVTAKALGWAGVRRVPPRVQEGDKAMGQLAPKGRHGVCSRD